MVIAAHLSRRSALSRTLADQVLMTQALLLFMTIHYCITPTLGGTSGDHALMTATICRVLADYGISVPTFGRAVGALGLTAAD
jgi:hypothetical protein